MLSRRRLTNLSVNRTNNEFMQTRWTSEKNVNLCTFGMGVGDRLESCWGPWFFLLFFFGGGGGQGLVKHKSNVEF